MIGGHKLPSRSPPPISSPPKTKLRYQTPPTQKVPSLKSLTQPNLIDAPDLSTVVSGFTYHCLGFTYRHLRIYLPSSRTYLLSSQFYLPSFLGLGSFWLGGLFRELLGGELFLGSLCPHTPKYIYLSKYIYYYHWRRSAVNSAGALRGILGNFHPQKHTYAHCTFHTINFGAGSKKWGCTCTCCTP